MAGFAGVALATPYGGRMALPMVGLGGSRKDSDFWAVMSENTAKQIGVSIPPKIELLSQFSQLKTLVIYRRWREANVSNLRIALNYTQRDILVNVSPICV